MKLAYKCLFLLFYLLVSPASHAQSDLALKKQARLTLKKALKKYRLKTMQIKVRQEFFITSIKESMKNYGVLNKNGKKFYLKLTGQPSSISLFDGQFLWYQTDINEKLVFQLKDHPQIQMLSALFDEKSFFELFQIQQAKKNKSFYILQLLPKKEIVNLNELFVKVGSHISEIRILWKDLDNWQKLLFSKPIYKKFPKDFFHFSTSGFQVLTESEF